MVNCCCPAGSPAARLRQAGEARGRQAGGFGVGGGEYPGGAELAGFGAGRNQDLGATGPPLPQPVPFARLVGPQVAAEQEPGQHRVIGGRGAVAAEQPQVAPLRLDDADEPGVERGGGVPRVRRPDPVPVPGAEVAVVRQQPGDRAAVVPGVAPRAAQLGLVPPGLPVQRGAAQLGQRPGQVLSRAAGDRRQPAGDDGAAAGAGLRGADLVPQPARVKAVQAGQPGQVGGEGFAPGGRAR